jgi:hypothetical protein
MTRELRNDVATWDDRPQRRWQTLVEVLMIVAIFFIATGDAAPNVNESHYLCRLKHYWNPSWCAGDLFLESSDTQLAFIWLFGWMTRFVSLTATAWIGRVFAWAALAWAWQRLSWRVVPRPFASVLSATIFLPLNLLLNMAGEWVVGGVEAKCFAYAFALWAIREMLDGRWNRCWLLFGCATALHPLVGGWCGIICAGIWLIDIRREQSLWEMLPGLIGGGLIGLIGIVPALLLTWGAPAEIVSKSNQIYVFDRLPHHLAPLTMPTAEVKRRLTGHAALVLAMCGLTIILWRMWSGQFKDERREDRNLHYTLLRRIGLFGEGAVFLAMIGLAIEVALASNPDLAAKLLRYYWFRTTDFAVAMTVALQLTVLIADGIDKRRVWALPLFFVTLLNCGWFLGGQVWAHYSVRIPPADNKATSYDDWVEVCNWVGKNTPPEALFLTPRLNSSFKWRAGRPEVVNRKDIPQDAADIVEWHDRLKDIYTTQFGGIDQNVDSVGSLGDDRVRQLAKKYHAQYVLSDRGQLLSLPIAFENEEYVVYRIEDNGASK